MDDVGFGVVLLVGGAALVVYSRPLGERARSRGAGYGRELYVVIGLFLVAFGATLLVRAAL
ncbi:MAG TPA: hypothetical protein VLB86_15670 [Gaiellaceae bacterium]|nr:hypothetical protein [Gaiellaceae bacterium]